MPFGIACQNRLTHPRAPGAVVAPRSPRPPHLSLQGQAAARQLPLMQRIVVANRAAANSGRLHDSYSEIDYDSPYKARK